MREPPEVRQNAIGARPARGVGVPADTVDEYLAARLLARLIGPFVARWEAGVVARKIARRDAAAHAEIERLQALRDAGDISPAECAERVKAVERATWPEAALWRCGLCDEVITGRTAALKHADLMHIERPTDEARAALMPA